ncbi:MAG: TraR/DksA C4-type zinc finger protein [Candidatus Omnitrophica bacterium]|nr:TraR/DksA C4-type zinc finger protein [Candidatus Omnitrophota bacterium]MBU4478105.1 TraR/DksA C4-type zinc finger protein [Candidatus Omnitrophota bacterium]MCG2702928.1 TraR/DksA C4-type zinc finger protein [Candidatus Omnitrophota bacterium]
MNKKEAQEFKKKLVELREKVTEEMKQIGGGSLKLSQRDASGDLSAYTLHMADVASDSFERELSWDRASGEQKVLFHIDDALRRIEEGVYGICESCGKKISKARLKAIPYALLCRTCKEKHERKK